MWENGDLVWANVSNNPSTYLPGMILDSHMPEIGILVSFFDLQNPRYFLPRQLHSFEPNFKTLVSNSPSSHHRRLVNRALRFLFRSISNSISCPCSRVCAVKQSSSNSFLFCTESALGFLRDAAVSPFVPPEGFAEATSFSAKLLCFRRYTVDYDMSKAVYEEIELGSHSLRGRDGIDDVNGIKVTSLLQAHSPQETLNNLRCLAVHPMHPERTDEASPSKSKTRSKPVASSESLLPSEEPVESAIMRLQQVSVEQTQSINDDPLLKPGSRKRKTDENESSGNSLKRSRVAPKGSPVDQPKQLFMKFLKYNTLPSKGELIKRFSQFGKIDALRTQVFAYTGSAKVVFMEHIDAVAALEYGKSKKIAFGQGSVIYWLGRHQDGNERRRQRKESEPVPKSCLKKKSSSGKRDSKRKRVRFRMETNG